MGNIYGVTGVRVKAIEAPHEDLTEVNDFLDEYDGNIIDIQTSPMAYGVTKYIIVYKAIE